MQYSLTIHELYIDYTLKYTQNVEYNLTIHQIYTDYT